MNIQARVIIDPTLKQAGIVQESFLHEIQKLLSRATLYLEAGAKKECPVDTGFLRNSHGSQIGFPQSLVFARANYAGYVHDGTRYIQANPWMERARNDTIRWLRNQKITIRKA